MRVEDESDVLGDDLDPVVGRVDLVGEDLDEFAIVCGQDCLCRVLLEVGFLFVLEGIVVAPEPVHGLPVCLGEPPQVEGGGASLSFLIS